jgi:ADP-ribose pyrophosphatase
LSNPLDQPPHDPPRILSREGRRLSPWVELIEKRIEFAPGEPPQTYHFVGLRDYVAILARTPAGRYPLVRQFRPAIEAATLELPAGMLDEGEDAEQCCRRELEEETGFSSGRVVCLGSFYSDTGRLTNRTHVFAAEIAGRVERFVPEPGLELELADEQQFLRYVRSGAFHHQLHLGVLGLLWLAGETPAASLGEAWRRLFPAP